MKSRVNKSKFKKPNRRKRGMFKSSPRVKELVIEYFRSNRDEIVRLASLHDPITRNPIHSYEAIVDKLEYGSAKALRAFVQSEGIVRRRRTPPRKTPPRRIPTGKTIRAGLRQMILKRLDDSDKLPYGAQAEIARKISKSFSRARVGQIVDELREEGLVKEGVVLPRDIKLTTREELEIRAIETAILHNPHLTNDEIRFVLFRGAKLRISERRISTQRSHLYERMPELKTAELRRQLSWPGFSPERKPTADFSPLGKPTKFAKIRKAILEAWNTGDSIRALAPKLKVGVGEINKAIEQMKEFGVLKKRKQHGRRVK